MGGGTCIAWTHGEVQSGRHCWRIRVDEVHNASGFIALGVVAGIVSLLSAGLSCILDLSGEPAAYLEDIFLGSFGVIICIVESKRFTHTRNLVLKRAPFLGAPLGRATFYLFLASSSAGEAAWYFRLEKSEENFDEVVGEHEKWGARNQTYDVSINQKDDSWKRNLVEDFQLTFGWFYRLVAWYLLFLVALNVAINIIPEPQRGQPGEDAPRHA